MDEHEIDVIKPRLLKGSLNIGFGVFVAQAVRLDLTGEKDIGARDTRFEDGDGGGFFVVVCCGRVDLT